MSDIDKLITKYQYNNTNKKFYYGCHMPNPNAGIIKAINAINNLKGNCLQIFISNPMSGRVADKHIDYYLNNSEAIKNLLTQRDTKLFIHSSYTYNFARGKDINESWIDYYWIENYIKELRIAHYIGAEGCVIHVGKQLKLTKDDAIKNMFNSLSFVIEYIKTNKLDSVIILETCAGQGTELFRTNNNNLDPFTDFYNMFSDDQKLYIKVCIDTCHIFAAGYDIREVQQCNNLFVELDDKIGIKNVALIHFNDSKVQYNKGVDRHENIGKGHIGITGLSAIAKYASKLKIPLILETPDNDVTYIEAINEIAMIKKIASE